MPLYFLALMLPDEISDQVTKLKEELERKYGIRHALKSPPHITLQKPFRRPQSDEPIFIENLSSFASGQFSFEIKLSGFSVFSPRVIFVDVVNTKELADRHENLQQFLQTDLDFPKHEPNFGFNPHVTIATRDLKIHFHEVWNEFKDRNFEANFMSYDLTMLKHNGKYWDVWHQFPWSE